MLRVILPTIALPLLLLQQGSVDAFVSTQGRFASLSRAQQGPRVTRELASSTAPSATTEGDARPRQIKELGLLTFDLDDTLYSISRVVESANSTFLKIFSWKYGMSNFDVLVCWFGTFLKEDIIARPTIALSS